MYLYHSINYVKRHETAVAGFGDRARRCRRRILYCRFFARNDPLTLRGTGRAGISSNDFVEELAAERDSRRARARDVCARVVGFPPSRPWISVTPTTPAADSAL